MSKLYQLGIGLGIIILSYCGGTNNIEQKKEEPTLATHTPHPDSTLNEIAITILEHKETHEKLLKLAEDVFHVYDTENGPIADLKEKWIKK